MKRLFISLVIIGLQLNGYSQDRYSAYQSVYDLGLISLTDPFLANRNSALLLGMRQYQVGFNINFKQPMQTSISVSGPIHHNLAIGITWDRSGENKITRAANSLYSLRVVLLCHACEYRHLLINCKYGDSRIRRNDSICYILTFNDYSSI